VTTDASKLLKELQDAYSSYNAAPPSQVSGTEAVFLKREVHPEHQVNPVALL
jgi:hypothetical protein